MGHHRQRGAGLHGLAVEMHDAGAALRGVAADVGTGQPQMLAEKLHQKGARIDIRGDGFAIHDQGNLGHMRSLSAPHDVPRGSLKSFQRYTMAHRQVGQPRPARAGHALTAPAGPS